MKTLTCSLYQLATNFDALLFDRNTSPGTPIADHWRIKGMNLQFWEIGDVRGDGKYMVYGYDWVDQDTEVEIYYYEGIEPPYGVLRDEEFEQENPIQLDQFGKDFLNALSMLQADDEPAYFANIALRQGANAIRNQLLACSNGTLDILEVMKWPHGEWQKKEVSKTGKHTCPQPCRCFE